MRIRKIIYISLLAIFMLTACGKQDKKEPVQSEKEESQKQNKEDSLNKDEDSQDSDGELSNTDKKTEDKSSTKTKTEEDNNLSNGTMAQNPTGGNTESGGTITQNPATGSNTQKPSNGSTTTDSNTQKPSNGNTGSSNNSGGANNSSNAGSSTTKKPVKRVSEEVKSDVVPYKYGITKYDATTNYYTLFSDNSKELLYSDSYTVYDSSNYSATDSQLKSEADSNASKYMSYYQEVLRLVNEIRAEAGVGPLTLDTTLCKAASMRALEMDYGNQMSHTRPSGKDCFSVLDFYGASFGTCGENIAAGQTSASSVVNGWKNSPGHYQNMINASYTKLGVGYSAMGVGDYGHYWCQLFTN